MELPFRSLASQANITLKQQFQLSGSEHLPNAHSKSTLLLLHLREGPKLTFMGGLDTRCAVTINRHTPTSVNIHTDNRVATRAGPRALPLSAEPPNTHHGTIRAPRRLPAPRPSWRLPRRAHTCIKEAEDLCGHPRPSQSAMCLGFPRSLPPVQNEPTSKPRGGV